MGSQAQSSLPSQYWILCVENKEILFGHYIASPIIHVHYYVKHFVTYYKSFKMYFMIKYQLKYIYLLSCILVVEKHYKTYYGAHTQDLLLSGLTCLPLYQIGSPNLFTYLVLSSDYFVPIFSIK